MMCHREYGVCACPVRTCVWRPRWPSWTHANTIVDCFRSLALCHIQQYYHQLHLNSSTYSSSWNVITHASSYIDPPTGWYGCCSDLTTGWPLLTNWTIMAIFSLINGFVIVERLRLSIFDPSLRENKGGVQLCYCKIWWHSSHPVLCKNRGKFSCNSWLREYIQV